MKENAVDMTIFLNGTFEIMAIYLVNKLSTYLIIYPLSSLFFFMQIPLPSKLSQTREPIDFSSRSSNAPYHQPAINKTKFVLSFLCLFDGLRTPSIRRLVRKPRTICEKPLVTFDPSCFAPSSHTTLEELYKNTLNCQSEIVVDPPIQHSLHLLRKYGTSSPQRLLIHYYGQGSHIPDNQAIYLFSEDHTRYKPLKIQTILNKVTCPLAMILDCSKAGNLESQFQGRDDLFVFFSCSANEYLPLSTDTEMDLFSLCLLSPFPTAFRWHLRRHNKIYTNPQLPSSPVLDFLTHFFHSVLLAILYDTQPYHLYQLYTRDPSIAALARGFALAQRVFLSYNTHPISIPRLESMEDHSLWSFWDIALDCGITLEIDQCSKMIFKLFSDSFTHYPTRSFYPIFSFFLETSEYHIKAATILLEYLDTPKKVHQFCPIDDDQIDSDPSTMAALSPIPTTIASLNSPSKIALIALSKMIATGKINPYDQNTSITFTASKDPEILKAGLLSLCCTVASSSIQTFSRLTQLCIDHAIDCAPFSSLLLGNLIEKAGRLMNLPYFSIKFLPLLSSERADVRASAAYLLGLAKDTKAFNPLVKCLHEDDSYIVRYQSAISLIELLEHHLNLVNDYLPIILEFQEKEKEITVADSEVLTKIIKGLQISADEARNLSAQSHFAKPKNVGGKTNLFDLLLQTVRMNDFRKKYDKNIFDISVV